jgi:CRP-like cAMP-binding protein
MDPTKFNKICKEILEKSDTRKLMDALSRPMVVIPQSPVYKKDTSPIDMEPILISPKSCMPFAYSETFNLFSQAFDSIQAHKIDQGLKKLKKILNSHQNKQEILNNIGICYLKLKNSQKAIKYLKYAIEANILLYIPYYNLSLVYFFQSDYQTCLSTIDKAMINIPNPPKDLFVIRKFSVKKLSDLKLITNDETYNSKGNTKFSISFTNFNGLRSTKSVRSPVKLNELFYQADARLMDRPRDFRVNRQRRKDPLVKHEGRSSVSPKMAKHQYKFKRNYKQHSVSKPSLSRDKSLLYKSTENYLPGQKGLIQVEGASINPLKNIIESSSRTNKIKYHIDRLQKELVEDMEINLENIIPSGIDTNNLTEQELAFIISQLDSPKEKRNCMQMDKILSRLHFFFKFSLDIRVQIYKIGSVCHFYSGKIIFTEGEIGKNMYVILKGSVSIEKKTEDINNYPVIVNSLYDGNHFGDLSFVGGLNSDPLNERTVTCICSEDTYLMAIPKKKYQKILLEVQKEQIENKLNFFCGLNIFKGIDSSLLMSLATNIKLETFELDEVIVKQGEIPKGLYVIYSGYAVLFTKGYRLRNRLGNEFTNPRKKKQRADNIINTPKDRNSLKSSQQLDHSQIATLKKYVSSKSLEKVSKEGCQLVEDWLEFTSIQSKDYFGGRVLLNANDTDPSLASKFTIIAKSSLVEVFVIDKSYLQFFTDEVVHQLKTIISKSFEVDCPPDVDTQTLDKTFLEWQEYKNNLLGSIERDRYIDKNKIYFPFMR